MLLCFCFQVILCLVILVMRKRIAFTVELYHQAGKALSAMPLLLVQPVWTFIILAVFFVYIAAVFVFISATGKSIAQYSIMPSSWEGIICYAIITSPTCMDIHHISCVFCLHSCCLCLYIGHR